MYNDYPSAYANFMSHHDCDHNVARVLLPLLRPTDVVADFGCGAGRITDMVSPRVQRVLACDASKGMVDYVGAKGYHNVRAAVATLGTEGRTAHLVGHADIVVAGWALSYVKQDNWGDPKWPTYVSDVIRAWERDFRPRAIVIFETLGTGVTAPTRKGDILDHEGAFQACTLRTDYLFRDETEAMEHLTFFFGAKSARRFLTVGSVLEERGILIPEVTAMYMCTYS